MGTQGASIKHGLTYSGLILIIVLLLFKQCGKPINPITPEKHVKETLVKGKPDTVVKEVIRYKTGTNPPPDTVYADIAPDTIVVADDSIRHYPLTENDSTGGTVCNVSVKGHLLGYDITRTCFNTSINRVDTLKQEYNKPRRLLSIGMFSGVMANEFTYGVSVLYQDKQQRYYGLHVDPVNKGGLFTIGVPVRLRR